MSERELSESAMTDEAAVRALRNRAIVEPLDLPPPSRRPRWVVRGLVGAVVLLFLGIVALAWREYLGPELQGEPPLVRAETTPYKVEPSEPTSVQAGETPSRAVMRGDDLPPDRLAGAEATAAPVTDEVVALAEPGVAATQSVDSAAAGEPDAAVAASTGAAVIEAEPTDNLAALELDATDASPALAESDAVVDPLEPLDLGEPEVGVEPAAEPSAADAVARPDAVVDAPANAGQEAAGPGTAGSAANAPGSIRADPIAPPEGVAQSDAPAPLAGAGELDNPPVAEPAAVPEVGEVLAALPSTPVPGAPVPRPKPRIAETSRAAATSASAPAARVEPAAGGAVWRVQVASMRDDQSARLAWDQVRARHPTLLSGLAPTIVRAEVASGTVYRVQIGPFPDRAGAASTCAALKAERTDCLVVGPVR